jgi:hypothetical protein
MKVVYKGQMQRVLHRGAPSDNPAANRLTERLRVPYEFIRGMPVEVTREEDVAMFEQMAKANPETWEIVTIKKKVAKALGGGDD